MLLFIMTLWKLSLKTLSPLRKQLRSIFLTPRSPCDKSKKARAEKRWIRTEEYVKYFKELENNVDFKVLNIKENEIHTLHKHANETGKFTYNDPETGLKVLSGLYHFLKGKCCGNACRHCPYEHSGVPEKLKLEKRFNSAFYVNIDTTNVLIIDPTQIPRRTKSQLQRDTS